MPLFDYHCRTCGAWERDRWTQLAQEAPLSLECPACGARAEKMPGVPTMMLPWNERPPIDGAHNIFEGTKLADGDGKNRAHYRSDKVQVDLGG